MNIDLAEILGKSLREVIPPEHTTAALIWFTADIMRACQIRDNAEAMLAAHGATDEEIEAHRQATADLRAVPERWWLS